MPIQPHDNTSHAYKAEPQKNTDKARFGMALSLSMVIFFFIFFIFLYEVITTGYERFK